MIAQHFDGFYDLRIVGCDRATFTACSQVLAWVKTKCRCASHRSGFHPPIEPLGEVLGAVRLASVFDDSEPIFRSQSQDCVHIRHLPVKVNRNNRLYRPSAPQTDEYPRTVSHTLFFEEPLEHRRRHVIGLFVDIDKFGYRTRPAKSPPQSR